jgi:hypothetical protein
MIEKDVIEVEKSEFSNDTSEAIKSKVRSLKNNLLNEHS